jgi:Bacterial PH domain
MGLLSGLFGHSSRADVGNLQQEFEPLLAEGEELVAAYRVLRDMIVFTTKRLILVNKQGVTGSKAEYLTIPYERIIRFSKESAGILDLEAELKIWIVGQKEPIQRTFTRNDNVNEVYQLLSRAVLDD